MKIKQETKEKICTFYASDYHFEMMSLPYIDQKIENKEEIVILTQNDLEKSVQTVLMNTNLREPKKERILKINWKDDDTSKIEQIKKKAKEKKDVIVFVKGKETYIKNMNETIQKYDPKNCFIKVIDCYEMDEIGDHMDEIMDQYKKVLNTKGEKEIQKI